MKIIDVGQTDLIRKKKIGVDLNVKIMREGNIKLNNMRIYKKRNGY